MSLKEKVMIVNLTISQWSARKYDQKATSEVEHLHNAKEAGRFNKILMQSDTLTNIGKVANKVRTYHYENTLPWGDNGDRILPTEKYFEYMLAVGQMKMEFNELVDLFITEYELTKYDAQRRLGTLYHETDYPQPESIRKKFDIGVGIMPIAESDDLRVNMSTDVVEGIKQRIVKELNDRVETATTDMLNRLREAVSKMHEKLADADAIFRDSLVGNIETLIETLPLMNFNDDARVTNAIDLCRGLIVDVGMLRDNKRFRKNIADKAKAVLNEIS